MGATKTFERDRMKEIRRKESDERNEYWRSLSKDEKVKSLDSRLGVGVGAKKQRTKLSA
jgi:hypothetical protein